MTLPADLPGDRSEARMLVVDDSKVNRLLMRRQLELLGYQADLAENGQDALQMLRANPYDLLLLDMEMPKVNGFQVMEQLVKEPSLRDVPVIVISSLEGVDNVARCIELGADDYLSKPVNPILLKARVGTSLEKKRLRDQLRELVRRFATSEVAADVQESGFSLGGKRIVGTAMFSDIRDFTALVESQSPEETIELLNTYYSSMFDAINAHGGVVNQMVGDGLMAIFGAPAQLVNHPDKAVLASIAMIESITEINQHRNMLRKPSIRIGIGIATGEMIAGYTGTQSRATYTCIGDAVNLAARLETHTKVARRSILIDAQTHAALSADIPAQFLSAEKFKGKQTATQVYAVQTK